MRLFAGICVAVCVAALLFFSVFFLRFNPSALPEPGKAETFLATTALRVLVWRQARNEVLPAPPADRQASLDEGDKLFGVECADCHGNDGHSPTDEGRWMYPRAANLVSHDVQQYTDRELFSVIKNGVRLSGMPAFARVETDAHIWNIVQYLRTLPGKSPETASR